MTIKEKIKSKNGYISKHEAMDPSLKIKAQNLTWEYNNTRPDENEKRSKILKELFGTCSNLHLLNLPSNVIMDLIFIQKGWQL